MSVFEVFLRCFRQCFYNAHARRAAVYALLAIVAVLASAPARGQAALQKLHGHLRPSVAEGKAQLAGAMLDDEKLSFSIVLPLRNETQLDALLHRLYDPSSSDYRQFLSVAQFTENFGPTAADYAAVAAFAKANGLEVTGSPANRMVVPLRGTVSAINSALHVRMSLYQHPAENRVFFSPDREPSLALSVPVAHIAGLNNFSIPKPRVQRSTDGRMAADVTGSGPGGSYLASDMRAAYYGGTQLTGTGQAVGLVEFGGYYLSDVNQTFSSVGQSYTVPINNVLLDGASAVPYQNESDGEQVLDIVQAIGMAPGLSQVRVYIGSGPDDANVLNSMASENIAKSLSCSWGWLPEDPGTDDVFFKEFAAQGQSFFVASGDYGAWDTAIDPYVYPSEDAYVTTVGGTHLTTLSAGGAWQAETAWNSSPYGSGGGISPDSIPIPSWQSGIATSANGASKVLRNGPDVSMEGDFDNYNCALGSCEGDIAGTSFAAPRWAAFIALVNQQASETGVAPNGGVGFLNPSLYSIGAGSRYANDFHDIVTGNNLTYGQPNWYSAVTGYDLVTGWGSPTGQNLINELAGSQTLGFWLSASSSSIAVNPGGSTSTTVSVVDAGGFTGKVQLAVTSALPAGVTAKWGTNPTTGSSLLTLTAASTAANTTTTLTITGTSGSITETTHITLTVHPPSFSLSLSPGSLGLLPGGTIQGSVTVTPLYGFTGSVTLAVSGLPTGVTAAFGTNPTTGTSLLTVQASSTAVAATSNITITGKSGQLTTTTTFPLTIEKPSFTLANSGDVRLGEGTSASTYIIVQDQFGFLGNVTLYVSGMPSGMTAFFSPNPATGYAILTLTASSATPVGTSTLTVLGKSGSLSATTTLKVSVLAPAFTLSQIGSINIGKGTSTTIPISVNPEYGFSGAVSFAVAGLPSGVTATLTPNPTVGSSALTLTASSAAATGSSAVTVTGTSGSLKATTSIALGVFTPTFTLAGSGAVSMAPGTSATTSLTLSPQYGFTGSVNLAVSGVPSGVTASISPNPTTGSAVLTLTAGASTPLGTSTLTITGVSGTQTAKATVPLSLVQPAFTLTGPGQVTVGAGSSIQASVSVNPEYGFTGSVTLAFAGLPSGVTASISPNPTTGNSYITLSAGSAVKPGNYTVTINGAATGAKAASTTFPLTVATPSFTLSNSGSVQLGQGTSTTSTIWMNSQNGFSGSAHLAVSGLPSGVTASFSPSLITGGGSTLTLSATGAAAIGTSTITVTGTAGSTTATTSFMLQVGAPTFTLSSIGGLTINPGGTTSTYLSINPLYGFTGSAALYLSGLPAGVTASFSPNLTSGSSQLFLTASSSVALGAARLTITAVSGSTRVTTTFPLTIASGSFSLYTANSVVQLAPGAVATDTVSVNWWPTSTTSAVSLAVSGLPSGVTASFSPSSTSSSSVLTLKAASTAVKGAAMLTITGTQGKTTATTTLQLQIESASFTLSSPSSLTIGQGQNATNYISINPIAGFTGAVNLSASGLPPGVTASFSANPAQSGSTLNLTASSTAALTGSVVTITGTSGSQTASTKFSLTVLSPSFTIESNGVSLGQGTSATTYLWLQGQNGFNSPVTFSITGLPSGVTASISPNPTTYSYSSTVTLTASPAASLGQYNAVITGVSGQLTASTLLNVTVGAPSFALSSYGSNSIGRGTSATIPVQVNPINGFTGSPQLSVTNLPAGVSASLLPNPTNSNSALTLNASSTAPLGQYNATLVGVYGKQTVSTPLNLTICAPSFSLYSYVASVLNPGSSTQGYVTITPTCGFSGAVRLSASGLPAGVTAAFPPASATTQSNVTFTAASSVSPGEYNVTVTGVYGAQTSSVVVPLTVAAPGFTLWSQNVSVGKGASASTFVSVYPQNGFNQPVRLAASGLPSGVTVSFSPNPSTGSANMTVTAAATVAAGQYLFTVTGTAGNQTAATTVQMTVGAPSFAVYASGAQVGQGYSSTEYVSVNSVYGFAGLVQFSVSGLPAGVTASFSPVSSTSGTTMTLTASGAAIPGQYNIVVTGKSGSLVESTNTVLSVTTPAFSLWVPSTANLGQGASATAFVYAQGQNGFAGNITFYISGLPSGVTAAFSPNPTTYNTTLTLTASSAAKAGQYTATIKGISGSITATTPFTFTVAPPSFTLGTYGVLQVGAGSSGQQSISVTPSFGFAGQVQFSASGLPAGMTASFSPATSTSGTNLTLAASASVKPGQYAITVTGKSGSITASTPVSVSVLTPTFTLSSNGVTNIGQGTSGTIYVWTNPQYGFTGNVQLSASGLPSGVTASFSPNPTTGQSVMTLTAASTASLGQYTVTVTGVSGAQSASTNLTLGVYVPTFNLSNWGGVNMGQGTTGTTYVNVNNAYGFTGQVQLSLSGLPAGVTGVFSPNPTTGQSTLTLTASSTTALGQYTLTVTGKSGAQVATTTIPLGIYVPAFTLYAGTGLGLGQGSTITDYLSINAPYGLPGKVQLAVTGLPSDVTASFSQNPTTGGSVLTLTASSTAKLGQYTLTVTGTAGTLSASATVTLGVYTPTFVLNDYYPGLTISPGSSGQVYLWLNDEYGFTGSVQLYVSGLPTGVTASFSPNPISSGGSYLTLNAASSVNAGQYSLRITGVSGSQRVSSVLPLTVN